MISGIAAGDESSSIMLRTFLLPGICSLLSHREVDVSAAPGILALVLREVREGTITSQAELLHNTRRAIIEASMTGPRPRSVRQAVVVNPGLLVQSPRDREMMERHFVDGEDPDSICRRMEVSLEDFQAVKRSLRAALTNDGKKSRQV